MSERMRSMLRLAEDEAGEMTGRAETEVNKRGPGGRPLGHATVAAARTEAEAIRAAAQDDAARSAEEIARARAEFEADLPRRARADRGRPRHRHAADRR